MTAQHVAAEREFAVVISALMAGRIDGPQAVASLVALSRAMLAAEYERGLSDGRAQVVAAVEALADEWSTTPGAFVLHGSVLASAWVSAVRQLRDRIAPHADALAKHDAEVLREAADRMPAFHDNDVPEWAITSAVKWLRDRADRIEAAS